jgi:hypothetical protein
MIFTRIMNIWSIFIGGGWSNEKGGYTGQLRCKRGQTRGIYSAVKKEFGKQPGRAWVLEL